MRAARVEALLFIELNKLFFKALAKEDTSLPTQMFPRLPARATFVADTNFVSGIQKCFWFCSETFCARNKCFPVCAAWETSWATMCPQQCVLVCQGLKLKLEVLSLSGKLFYKYGNLLKKVPLYISVLTWLIFNLLLEYDLNLWSEQKSKCLPTE